MVWGCNMDSFVNTGTPVYVTSSTASGNYFRNSAYYQSQIAQLQSQITDSLRRYINDEIYNHITQTLTIDRAEAERIDAEFTERLRNFVNIKCVTDLDKSDFEEETSDELNEFLDTFKIKDRGCKS